MEFDERKKVFNKDFLDSYETEKMPIRANWPKLVWKKRKQEQEEAKQKRRNKLRRIFEPNKKKTISH